MSSQKCINCGLANFENVECCKRCKVPLGRSKINAAHSNRNDLKQSTVCPSCSSGETQSFKMAHETGTSFGKVSVASYSEDFGVAVSSGTVSNQTILAQQLNPPVEPSSFVELFLALIPSLLIVAAGLYIIGVELPVFLKGTTLSIAMIIGLLITFGIPALILFFASKWQNKASKKRVVEYNGAMTQWLRSWICMRCGSKWVV